MRLKVRHYPLCGDHGKIGWDIQGESRMMIQKAGMLKGKSMITKMRRQSAKYIEWWCKTMSLRKRASNTTWYRLHHTSLHFKCLQCLLNAHVFLWGIHTYSLVSYEIASFSSSSSSSSSPFRWWQGRQLSLESSVHCSLLITLSLSHPSLPLSVMRGPTA